MARQNDQLDLLSGKRIFRGVIALALLTGIAILAGVNRSGRVGEKLQAANGVYIPALKHLNIISGKWESYRRTIEKDIQFNRWGAKGFEIERPRLNLKRILDADITALSLVALKSNDKEINELVAKLKDTANNEQSRLAELAVLVKNRQLDEAAVVYMKLRTSHSNVTQDLLAMTRALEVTTARLQISAEQEVHVTNAILILGACLCLAALIIVAMRMRRLVEPLFEWRQAMSTMAIQISRGGFEGLKSRVELPSIDSRTPPEIAHLTREIGNMATTVMEHERTIQAQKGKLEGLNSHLREHNRMLRKLGSLNERILNAISSAILVLDGDHKVEQFNETFCRIFALDRADMIGTWGRSLLKGFSDHAVEQWIGCPGESRWRRVKRKDGRFFDVCVEQLPSSSDTGGLGRVISFEDVTVLVDSEEKLAHAQKLTLAGTLSAQVAHEIRNPLNSMMLQLEMLEEDLAASQLTVPHASVRVKRVCEQVERLDRLTKRYLGVSGARPQATRSPVSINELIESTLDFRSAEIQAKGVRVELVLVANDPQVLADPDEIVQVVQNLISNAIDALDDVLESKRTLTLETRVAKDDHGKDKIIVSIKDGGRGVPAEIQAQIFEPFVTGKVSGHGLGLSVARQICLDHGGDLKHITSSTFEVSLPC